MVYDLVLVRSMLLVVVAPDAIFESAPENDNLFLILRINPSTTVDSGVGDGLCDCEE